MLKLEINIPDGYGFVAGKAGMKRVLRRAGAEIAARARALIRQRAAGGAKRTSSAPGQPPVSRTGALAASVKVRVWNDGDGVSIRDTEFYAKFLETGARGGGNPGKRAAINPKTGKPMRAKGVYNTRVLLPRPFLSTAFEEVANNSLGQRVVDAVVQGLDFRRGPKR